MATAVLTAESKIMVPEFRVSYPWVWTPQVDTKSGRKTWGVTAIFKPTDDLSQMRELMKLVKAKALPGYTGYIKSPFRKGVAKDENNPIGYDLDKNPEYAGMIIVPLKSINQPVQPLKPDKTDFTAEERAGFYAGCYADAFVTCYYYKNESEGISFSLQSLRKTRDGAPFGRVLDGKKDYEGVPEIVPDNSAEFDDDNLGV